MWLETNHDSLLLMMMELQVEALEWLEHHVHRGSCDNRACLISGGWGGMSSRMSLNQWSWWRLDEGRCEQTGSQRRLSPGRWTGSLLCSVGWSGCVDTLREWKLPRTRWSLTESCWRGRFRQADSRGTAALLSAGCTEDKRPPPSACWVWWWCTPPGTWRSPRSLSSTWFHCLNVHKHTMLPG